MPASGVYPVFENQFKIGKNGVASVAPTDFVPIADMESFSVSYDNTVEEWTPMTTDGWMRRLMTGKSVTISLSGKRNIGDEGNDYVASMAFKTGQAAETVLQWEFPDGTVVSIPVVVSVTADGGDSTAVNALEFDAMSNGKPTITEPAG